MFAREGNPMGRLQEESIEELLVWLEREEAVRCGAPTPEEIAERAAEIRRGWCDENGVLKPNQGAIEAAYKAAATKRMRKERRKRK